MELPDVKQANTSHHIKKKSEMAKKKSPLVW
jgi:hypothetical protein